MLCHAGRRRRIKSLYSVGLEKPAAGSWYLPAGTGYFSTQIPLLPNITKGQAFRVRKVLYRATMSPRQQKSTPVPPNSYVPVPGVMPPNGLLLSAAAWALVFSTNEKTISDAITKNNIRCAKLPGDVRWVRTEEMLAAFPERLPSEMPSNRGGNRRKG